MSAIHCPLNDLDLPPVSEVEHSAYLCYCHKCTCKEHICPGDKKRVLRPSSSMFLTNYKNNYRKTKPQPVLRHKRDNKFVPKASSAWKTTVQEDYVAHKVHPQVPLKRVVSAHLNVKLAGRSLYQADFPNWGSAQVEKHQPFRPKIESLPLNQSTTYQTFHSGKEALSPPKPCKFTDNYSIKKDWFGESLTKRDYKEFKNAFPKREKGRSSNQHTLMGWTSQFVTSYRENFKGITKPNLSKKKFAVQNQTISHK